MATACYSLYGLTVRSPLPLPAATRADQAADLDVLLCAGKPIPDTAPAGRLLAEHRLANGLGHAHVATDDGYLLRYYRACDFRYDRTQRRIEVFPDPAMADGYPAVLLAGSVLASLLALAGETVLHASAVAVDGGVVAFPGHSGRGKSTVAALCCAAGAQLVTDDVLRVLPGDAGLRCRGGMLELRLRPAARELQRLFGDAVTGQTADGRFAVRPQSAPDTDLPLRAVVLPRPSRGTDALDLHRLDRRQALVALLSCPRILGWREHDVPAAELKILARLAAEIPVYTAEIPWGPPFDPQHAAALLRAVCAPTEPATQ